MDKPVFKRKIYDEIYEWKENRSDKYALLIKGARRVGKSTTAEEFAKKSLNRIFSLTLLIQVRQLNISFRMEDISILKQALYYQ